MDIWVLSEGSKGKIGSRTRGVMRQMYRCCYREQEDFGTPL